MKRFICSGLLAYALALTTSAQETVYYRTYATDNINVKRGNTVVAGSQVESFLPDDRLCFLSADYGLQVQATRPDGSFEVLDLSGLSFTEVDFSTLLEVSQKSREPERRTFWEGFLERFFGYRKGDSAQTELIKDDLPDTDVIIQIQNAISEGETYSSGSDSLVVHWVSDGEVAIENRLGRDIYVDILCYGNGNRAFSAISAANSFVNDSLIPDEAAVSFSVQAYGSNKPLLVVASDMPIPFNMLDYEAPLGENPVRIPLTIVRLSSFKTQNANTK